MHTVERKGDEIESASQIGDGSRRMVVEYAFGTPQHYLTHDRPRRGAELPRPAGLVLSHGGRLGLGRRRPATSATRTRWRTGAASGSTSATAWSAACIATSRARATSATRRRPAGRPRGRRPRHRLRAVPRARRQPHPGDRAGLRGPQGLADFAIINVAGTPGRRRPTASAPNATPSGARSRSPGTPRTRGMSARRASRSPSADATPRATAP